MQMHEYTLEAGQMKLFINNLFWLTSSYWCSVRRGS